MTERAGVYGGSLYDLAAEEKLTDVIMEQLTVVRQIFRENPEYIRLLSEPSIKFADRSDLIEKAFASSCERYLVSFIKLLCERSLLGEFEGCCETFRKRFNADHNIADAVVTSAVALSNEQLEALGRKLEEISGKKVSLIQKLDPNVLAGIKVEIEGRQLDGTVSGRMSGISKKLNEIII